MKIDKRKLSETIRKLVVKEIRFLTEESKFFDIMKNAEIYDGVKVVDSDDLLDAYFEGGQHLSFTPEQEEDFLRRWAENNNALFYQWSGNANDQNIEIEKNTTDAKSKGYNIIVMQHLSPGSASSF